MTSSPSYATSKELMTVKLLLFGIFILLGAILLNEVLSPPPSSTKPSNNIDIVKNEQLINDLKVEIESLKEKQIQTHRALLKYENSQERMLTTEGEATAPNYIVYTCSDCPISYTHAARFSIVGDGVHDDTESLQRAIDYAADDNNYGKAGGTIILPSGNFLTTSPLVVPGGITIKGQGYGSRGTVLSFDKGSSVIAYCGSDYAVKIKGHNVQIDDLAVYDWRAGDCDNVKAKGGIILEANNNTGIESVSLSNLLIYWFMNGTALTLEASEHSGIAYSSFKDLRLRHAKTALHLVAKEEGSFVNSNNFWGGAISGGITDYGLLAEGPGPCNDNKFYGMVIEPGDTGIAHVYVRGHSTNIVFNDVRLEGSDMDHNTQPLVIIEDDSYGNKMNGLFGHTFIKADFNRNPDIDYTTNKFVSIDPLPQNLLWNAGFNQHTKLIPNPDVVSDYLVSEISGWQVDPGSFVSSDYNITINTGDEDKLYPNHHILRFNGSGTIRLKPVGIPKAPIHSFITFGVMARSSVAGSINTIMKGGRSGTTLSSSPHTGSGEWEFIGMSTLYDKQTTPYTGAPEFDITGDVEITAPTFMYGSTPAMPGGSLLSSSGAQMAGTLALGITNVWPPASGSFWLIPKNEGNTFVVHTNGVSQTITRINHSTADRFPKGTIITLLFPNIPNGEHVSIVNGGYIKLKGQANVLITQNYSSISLISMGTSWDEYSRNI